MKRLGRILGGLIAVALMAFSLQSAAVETQQSGRDFNHMSTGFMLQGGHAIAACETCHIGGVFKGTPRACDGCHALGKRIVATPKSSAHIVTDAPCDTCHFNTSTFYGARYNHANAVPGQCRTCHNGRLSEAKPNSHSTGAKATKSCDQCHRSVAWIPATWNHTPESIAGKTCNDAACHSPGGEAGTKTVYTNPKHLPFPTVGTAPPFASCQTCHFSFVSFTLAKYNHPGGLVCDDCHNATYLLGAVRGLPSNHIPLNSSGNCSTCHTNTTSWGVITMGTTGHALVSTVCTTCHDTGSSYLGKMQKKTTRHIPFNGGVACTSCHTSMTAWSSITGASLHTYVSTTCITCHLSGTSFSARLQQVSSNHENRGSKDCSASGCHRPLGSRGTAYVKWD
jgi:hypothetical protein